MRFCIRGVCRYREPPAVVNFGGRYASRYSSQIRPAAIISRGVDIAVDIKFISRISVANADVAAAIDCHCLTLRTSRIHRSEQKVGSKICISVDIYTPDAGSANRCTAVKPEV